MSIMNGTLAILEPSGGFLALSTYNRQHGRIGRFLIDAAAFSEWFTHGIGEFYDRDIGFVFATIRGNHVQIRLLWHRSSSNGYSTYADQTVAIPVTAIDSAIAGEPIRRLYIEDGTPPRLDFTQAAGAIREICSNKRKRRAFCKAVRDSFQWRRSSLVTFYNDFPPGSFFFREKDGIHGGFILHQSKKQTKAGITPCFVYSVHT